MGVDARAVAMYGVYLEDKKALTKFLETYGIEDADDLNTQAEVCCLNYYSGYPYIVGYNLDLKSPIDKYVQLWEKEFPNSPVKPDTHLDVVWY